MYNNFIKINKAKITPVSTSHGIGFKQIFLSRDDCESNLMQVAYGILQGNEKIEEHTHPTMEEFYFFESGESYFFIENEEYLCKKGDFIMVPAGSRHFMEAKTEVSFIYWGVCI